MPAPLPNPFGARGTLKLGGQPVTIYRLPELARQGLGSLDRLPFSVRVLLENALRWCGQGVVTEEHVRSLAAWPATAAERPEIPFMPARVVLQDFTGVPCVVDLAAMRDAMAEMGGDPNRINPVVPCDLVIDHSVQVDHYGTPAAFRQNVALEFSRNAERYQLLKFAQRAFHNFRVVPPGMGIVHQVNLEHLSPAIQLREQHGLLTAYPDTLVGTDSHTTMINGLGVVGWGVGGIEAEAVMLGQPYFMLVPDVIGMKLTGALPPGTTATDLVLRVTQMLRQKGVVDKFVEFYGPGLSALGLADRATIANMAPEYGATVGFFPIDAETLRYLQRTGRSKETVDLVERYTREQGLFRTDATPDPEFTSTIELDLASIEPSLAGPKRPQDMVPLRTLRKNFAVSLPGLMQPTVPGARRDFASAEAGRWANEGGGQARRPRRRRACRCTHQRRGARAARWLGRDRRHHLVHQHLQPLGHDRCRAPRQEGGRQGPPEPSLGQDQPGPGVARGHRLPARRRPDALPRPTRLPDRRVRLHHLHRQQRPAPGAGGPRHRGALSRGGGGPLRQPELRGPGPSAGPRQLPRLSDAGGGLCPPWTGRCRPDDRAAGHLRRRRAGVPAGHLAHLRRKSPRRWPPR